MNDLFIIEASHDLHYGLRFSYIIQEFVPQALAFAGTLH